MTTREIASEYRLAQWAEKLRQQKASGQCKCYSKKGPKKGIVIIEKSPTRPPKSLSVVG